MFTYLHVVVLLLLEYKDSAILTECKHLHNILDILKYFNFKNFYKCLYAYSVNSTGSHNV